MQSHVSLWNKSVSCMKIRMKENKFMRFQKPHIWSNRSLYFKSYIDFSQLWSHFIFRFAIKTPLPARKGCSFLLLEYWDSDDLAGIVSDSCSGVRPVYVRATAFQSTQYHSRNQINGVCYSFFWQIKSPQKRASDLAINKISVKHFWRFARTAHA